MKNIFRIMFAALLVVSAVIPGKAEVFKFEDGGNRSLRQTTAGCSPSSAFEWLDINNVRTRINAGGDMWWDLPSGTGSKYFIPANGSATSLFAGSLWIAGVDVNNQLKCAAMRFRQVGNDYWTGPLTIDGTAAIDEVTCAKWDKIFKITRAEVDDFLAHCDDNGIPVTSDGYEIPSIITKWPAHPDETSEGVSHYLAPFYDNDGDGEYDPNKGDYPYYDITNELCHTKIPTMDEELEGSVYGSILADQVLKGDQTLWWIFNDKGNSHTESSGQAIGIEVRAQAFAFATNDEINNMSFYSYEIINRSTYTLTGTYFSPWTDIDLGYGWDDYVGCDVLRGLGYGYNGKAVDGSGEPESYGSQPPALGIDFFQGPYMDADGIDNPKYSYVYSGHYDPTIGDTVYVVTDSTIMCDESVNGVNFGNGIVDDERFGMRRFVYHDNSSAYNGDPQTAPEYYNYLRGIWRDGTKMRYGGNAYSGSDVVGPECDFMFPGDTDPCNWGTHGLPPNGGYLVNGKYWTEEQCGNSPNDRRFMQSAGPFTLEPGAVNYITFGVPWARATSGGPWASVELLRVVDDKCQALFDNCFKVIDGPNAPDLTIRELDQELIIYLSNSAISNNYKEGYIELDPEIPTSRIDEVINEVEVQGFVHCADTMILYPHSFDPAAPVDTIACNIGGIDTVLYIPQGYYGGSFDTIYAQVGCVDTTFVCSVQTSEETFYDRYYRFEGYKVYQLANAEVGADELDNTSKARLVFQCDIKNNVTTLVNYEFDESIQANVPKRKVVGADGGISHSFVVTEDAFSTSENPTLVNHKTYYFMAVAYSYNNYLTYSQEPGVINGLYGQMKPYLEGRKNIQCYSAVPHKTVNGTVLQCSYGDQPSITRIVGIGNGGNELELTEASVNEIMFKADGTPKVAYSDSTVVLGHPDYPINYHPQYEAGFGPINVKIIDPLNVVATDYELRFDDMEEVFTENVISATDVYLTDDGTNYYIGNKAGRMASHWFLDDLNDDQPEIQSDTLTIYPDEKMFIDRGISVCVSQVYNIGPIWCGYEYDDNQYSDHTEVVAPNNGVINSSIEFDDPTDVWMDGIRDKDVPGTVINWIRSGQHIDQDDNTNSDFNMTSSSNNPYDPWENFEKIAYGTWAPYVLCSFTKQGFPTNPGPVAGSNTRDGSTFKKTASVDIVFTSDKSKWTRCPVIEMCMDERLSENGAKRFFLRKHASVDKNGQTLGEDYANMEASNDPESPNYIAAQGMGWFPGYAIDVETGARLNIAFGEDSYLADMNGRDMMFNPTKLLKSTVDEEMGDYSQLYDPNVIRNYGIDDDPVMGGKHFVYIWRMDSLAVAPSVPYKDFYSPAYDAGAYLYRAFNYIQGCSGNIGQNLNNLLYSQVMYIGMPMGIEGKDWLPEGNDCRIRIRVAKPYAPGYAPVNLLAHSEDLDQNDLNPKYKFSIDGLNPVMNDPEKSKTDLDLITVVPNPYYAYASEYEGNALTNRVKITNLPRKCVVTIYTLSGTKVRQFQKDNDDPNINWDLTNFANTPIASGFYLIHVKDYTSGGEKVVKFFGAMRKVDLNTF